MDWSLIWSIVVAFSIVLGILLGLSLIIGGTWIGLVSIGKSRVERKSSYKFYEDDGEI